VLLVAWQFHLFKSNLPDTFSLSASSGLHAQKKFLYYLYYLDLFPVASTDSGRDYQFVVGPDAVPVEPDRLIYDSAAARQTVATRGNTLVMEWGHTIRTGGLLETYLFLPDAWRLRSPQHAEVRITNGAMFLVSLLLLYSSAWYCGAPVFGSVLVALLGSNPFQLFEAYRRENVFAWVITSFCLVLALSLPLLLRVKVRTWYLFAAPLGTGLLLGTVAHIRPEPLFALLVALLAVVLAARPWRYRLLMSAIQVAGLLLSQRSWHAYFQHKSAEAASTLRQAGGHVYTGVRDPPDIGWHVIWKGLGDFDRSHGYVWDDAAAITYSQPVLAERYHIDLPWWWGVKGKEDRAREAGDYYDTAGVYYRIPWEAPHYAEVLREKVLRDIASEPLWYLEIIGRRVSRILVDTTPARLTAGPDWFVPVPFSGLAALAFALAFVVARWTTGLKLLACSAATSLSALLIYSGGNIPYYGVFHLVALALGVTWLAAKVAARFGRRLPDAPALGLA